jgi:hypothetical protein
MMRFHLMKSRYSATILTTALALSLSLSACGGGKGSGHSALLTPPPPVTVTTPTTVAVPVPVTASKGRPKGGGSSSSGTSDDSSGTPSSGGADLGTSTPRRRGGPSSNEDILNQRGTYPAADHPGSAVPAAEDTRDVGRRLEDTTCTRFRAVTTKWTVKVDDVNWKPLDKDGDKRAKRMLETGAREFFDDAICAGLAKLSHVNEKLAIAVHQKIAAKKLEIVIKDKNEAGKFKKADRDWWQLFLDKDPDKIELGREALQGLVAALAPEYAVLLAPEDGRLKTEPKTDHEDIMRDQIRGARALIFHYMLHMAKVTINKDLHKDESFLGHRKELDLIHACTAQVYPHFYIDAVNTDEKGQTQTGPFYRNTKTACLACASGVVGPDGIAKPNYYRPGQEVLAPIAEKCSRFKDNPDENVDEEGKTYQVTPDRGAFLYEGMN